MYGQKCPCSADAIEDADADAAELRLSVFFGKLLINNSKSLEPNSLIAFTPFNLLNDKRTQRKKNTSKSTKEVAHTHTGTSISICWLFVTFDCTF